MARCAHWNAAVPIGSCDAITRRRIEQADLAGIDRKSRGFAQTVAEIRRYPAERAVIAKAQHNDGLRSGRLDHFHRSSYGKGGVRRVAEMSCRLGDAFGPNAEHNLAANPAFGCPLVQGTGSPPHPVR